MHAGISGQVLIHDGRVGTVYNFGVPIRVKGPGTVRIVTAGTERVDGVTQLDPLVGHTCGGKAGLIYADAGADLRRKPDTDLRLPKDAPVRASERDPCWYVLLRFVPQRTGLVTADAGFVVYRVGLVERRVEFDFHCGVDVTGHGPDDRDRY